MHQSVVILGAGDLGSRVALLQSQRGDVVFAMRRRNIAMPVGVQAVIGDMHEQSSLNRLPISPDTLLFCATPDARTESAYRHTFVAGVQKAMQILRPKRMIFISSTAVYAQNAGEWVDESSVAEADSFNGRVLREAEALCLSQSGNTVLRLSGITGPNRNMLVNKALLGENIANTWTNRIHIDDAAEAVSHILQNDLRAPVYLVSDNQPALQADVVNWIRARHASTGSASMRLAPIADFSEPASGRRVSNACLKATGWQPRYPSYREIYANT